MILTLLEELYDAFMFTYSKFSDDPVRKATW